jgi:hypothetical protein
MLVDRHSIFALPVLFFANIFVLVVSVILFQLNQVVGILFAWAYLYYVLLQTRIIVVLTVFGTLSALLLSLFVTQFTVFEIAYMPLVVGGSSLLAHGVAYTISLLIRVIL